MIGGLRSLLPWLFVLVVVLDAKPSFAHPLDTAALSLLEESPGRFQVTFQVGSPTLQRELERPGRFPAHCRFDEAVLDCGARGLSGTIEFPWLRGSMTRLMLDVVWLDGSRLLRIATSSRPEVVLYGPASSGVSTFLAVLVDYGWLGVEHILGGFDHLFFVIALALLVGRGRPLLWTITAFTLAHSVTLACTVLGLVQISAAPVEAMIALSIVLLCRECLRRETSLTRRIPWVVAFAFGLLHGLGFASALLGIGLPPGHVPSALLSFNLGVEAGQLAVLAVFLLLVRLGQRHRGPLAWISPALVYAMASVAAYWSLERVGAVLGG